MKPQTISSNYGGMNLTLISGIILFKQKVMLSERQNVTLFHLTVVSTSPTSSYRFSLKIFEIRASKKKISITHVLVTIDDFIEIFLI